LQTVRERLRDTYRDAAAHAGGQRAELDLRQGWAPGLHWVLEGWSGRQLAIALDATPLGRRWVLLVLSVVYRGCAVPILGKVVPAASNHPWQPAWLALVQAVRGRVPPPGTVSVLAARGWYAQGGVASSQQLGGPPRWRGTAGGTCRPAGG
jgi:hypothetical protein